MTRIIRTEQGGRRILGKPSKTSQFCVGWSKEFCRNPLAKPIRLALLNFDQTKGLLKLFASENFCLDKLIGKQKVLVTEYFLSGKNVWSVNFIPYFV